MKTKDLLSKRRQILRRLKENKLLQAKLLEIKPYLLINERLENLAKARLYREDAEKLSKFLDSLNTATYKQKLAGWC